MSAALHRDWTQGESAWWKLAVGQVSMHATVTVILKAMHQHACLPHGYLSLRKSCTDTLSSQSHLTAQTNAPLCSQKCSKMAEARRWNLRAWALVVQKARPRSEGVSSRVECRQVAAIKQSNASWRRRQVNIDHMPSGRPWNLGMISDNRPQFLSGVLFGASCSVQSPI